MLIVKALGNSLLFVALLYVFFRYAGEFSTRQSVVLTAVGWMGSRLYERLNLSRKTEDVFTPFRVSCIPNWYELLSDFKLIRGQDDWKRLCDAANKLPASTFSALRQGGFSFTVIRPPSSGSMPPGLAFWNNEKTFLNDLELEASVIEPEDERLQLRHGEKHDFFDHPSFASLPRLVFKFGVGGYEIGLDVQAAWWEERCQSGELKELANVKQNKDYLCGTARLVVATLPYS